MNLCVKIYVLDSYDLRNVRSVLVYVSTCCWCSGLHVGWVGSLEHVLECQKTSSIDVTNVAPAA